MPKYCVQIFGKVPDQMEIEAKDEDEALDKAVQAVMDELDFLADLDEDEPTTEQKGTVK